MWICLRIWWRDSEEGKKRESKYVVECGHVELVKSYAPGVWHCVLDIVVGPSG